MSNFNVLFKKYHTVSSLTDDLNNSVLTLKRQNLAAQPVVQRDHPDLDVSETEVSEARSVIKEVLADLKEFIQDKDANSSLYELLDNDHFREQILHNSEFKRQLTSALGKLQKHRALTMDDLSNIDTFISILDNEAGVLFRKLRTREG